MRLPAAAPLAAMVLAGCGGASTSRGSGDRLSRTPTKQWQLVSQSQGFTGVPDPDYPAGPCDAATDTDSGTVVMVCSFSSNNQSTGATWTFDGSTWTRAAQATTVLPPVPSLSLSDDSVAGAVVIVYPGAGGTEAMRLWNGSDWAAIPAA